ncbi:hypothetical protein EYF80_016688 [Liparis tanakae]|uniref:Uncharacterized protein n=1 Tax=Liparis tanakae TaxID=230148 RepID=A0A4Z2I4X5_9TELE|nr:hypothetical protein EYF80_016688 [Liparis tanakae]
MSSRQRTGLSLVVTTRDSGSEMLCVSLGCSVWFFTCSTSSLSCWSTNVALVARVGPCYSSTIKRDFPLRGSESSTSSTADFSVTTASCWRWLTSSCLNSSWVLASRSFCLKEMSENIEANVLPSSTAVLCDLMNEDTFDI